MASLWRTARRLLGRRRYYLARVWRPKRRDQPLAVLPNNMSIHRIADTGITAIDNFCTAVEADYLIDKASTRLTRDTVVASGGESVTLPYRTSSGAYFLLEDSDPVVIALASRAAVLLGLPLSHVEPVNVTHYAEGHYYKGHLDVGNTYSVDRLFTVLVYLNDLEEGQQGATVFRDLNLLAYPKQGRALCWENAEADGYQHPETWHAALPPVGKGAEKWIAQLWLRAYRFGARVDLEDPLRHQRGSPLRGDEALPDGFDLPGPSDMEPELGEKETS